jgi:hypothetical protein
MPTIDDTAYPRLRASIPRVELEHFYTPTQEEIEFSKTVSRVPSSQAGFLILLKTLPRLGYFTPVAKVPSQIVNYILKSSGLSKIESSDLVSYEKQLDCIHVSPPLTYPCLKLKHITIN